MPESLEKTVDAKAPSYKSTLYALALIFVFYLLLLLFGLPQQWTNAQFARPGYGTADLIDNGDGFGQLLVPERNDALEHAESEEAFFPPLWTSLPFVALLLCIAILPLIRATEHWWESNFHRFIVAACLALITLGYYAFVYPHPVELHWPAHQIVSADAGWFNKGAAIFINAILGEYVSFIVLLFSLFSITGGIRISGDLKATPLVNSAILAVGALLASFVGTTGAAMLLIRLLLETNQHRKHKVHTVVFFIFCVCNVGGCLLPIGDPPLFLGYLRGVAFLWTFHLWAEWLFCCGILIALYYVIDALIYYPKEMPLDKIVDDVMKTPLKISGLFPNLFCLIGVVLAVMLLDPAQEFLALFGVKTGLYPPMFLREFVQLAMVFISFAFGSNAVRKENNFNFGAITEVAALFFGIFICMQAPLQILNAKGAELTSAVDKYASKIGLNEPKEFFWLSGCLSSVLDNAPTYVVFFETARAAYEGELKEATLNGDVEKAEKIEAELNEAKSKSGVPIPIALLTAVSIGSVFMGAMTYIGNGPNFMVKAIAEQSGVKTPSFFGYMGYSLCILLPILIIMTVIFL